MPCAWLVVAGNLIEWVSLGQPVPFGFCFGLACDVWVCVVWAWLYGRDKEPATRLLYISGDQAAGACTLVHVGEG